MENPLWEFSVRVYASPGVAAACLSLQDRFGADVNLLLAAAYLGSRGHELSATDARSLADLVRDWQEQVVSPVRKARKAMKHIAEKNVPNIQAAIALARDQVKSIELDAERVEQDLIFTWLRGNESRKSGGGSESVVRANVLHVLRLFDAEGSAVILAPLLAASYT